MKKQKKLFILTYIFQCAFHRSSEICNYNIAMWAAICQKVIHHLRHIYGYNNLFMNYRAFKKGRMCKQRKIYLPNALEPVKQNSLPCYCRPAISEVGMPNQFLQYYKDIIIFPHSTRVMMIFQRDQITRRFSVLEFLKNIKWVNVKPVEDILFTIPTPKVRESIGAYIDVTSRCEKLYDER